MKKIKSPNLLARVSNLMIIHVLFIFAALALVLLFGNDHSILANHFKSVDDRLLHVSSAIFSELDTEDIAEINDPRAEDILTSYSEQYDFISGIKLVELGSPLIESRPVTEVDNSADWKGKSKPTANFISSLSDDRSYIDYFISPADSDGRFALVVGVSNVLLSNSSTDLTYVLLLLFLVSTLISLLMVNLIHKNIRQPLSELVTGFKRTAEGEEFKISSQSDEKDLAFLGQAFNDIVENLADNRKKLRKTNSQLYQSKKSLKESESIMTSLIDYSPDAIIVTDMNDKIIINNLTAAEDFEYEQDDMLGVKINEILLLNGDKDSFGEEEGLSQTQEIICRCRSGRKFPALMVQTSLKLGEDNTPTSRLYFLKNISDSRNYQEMVIKLDRIASRGKMARGIAHEINNYLAILQGNLELLPLLLAKGDQEKVDKKIELMRGTVDNITKFTQGLSRFSDENSEFAKEDLNQLIENLIAFVKPQNKFDDIEFETILADNIPLVEIDVGQLQLLLVNLLYNAAEAMDETTAPRRVTITTSFREEKQAFTISVGDNGHGVNPDDRERLFVNRFSTRQRGNGLGLITAKNVVDNHQGVIKYYPGETCGSVFSATIPVKHKIDEETKEPIAAMPSAT